MNRKRQHQIEEQAESILRQTGCYQYPPILVRRVAQQVGIEIIEFDFGTEVSGLLMTQNERTTIGVNSENHEKRKRFTIAHELGHYFLGHQRQGMFVDTADKYFTIFNFRNKDSSTGEHLQEREANAFAASLLMPTGLIMSAIKEMSVNLDIGSEDVDVVKELANVFNVSNQAMGLRLSNLGSIW